MTRFAPLLAFALVLPCVAWPGIAKADDVEESTAGDSAWAPEEPPQEAAPDRDFEADLGDTLENDRVELGYGLSGRSLSAPRTRRRLRLRADGIDASVREGPGDALAGGAIEARALGGVFALGRRSPRWGRGLVIGTPREPWRGRGLEAPVLASRAAAGDGLAYRSEGPLGLTVLAQHAAHDTYAGTALGGGDWGVLFIASRSDTGSRAIRTALALRKEGAGAFGAGASEIALDARGRWRAEGDWRPAGAGLGFSARLGHGAFEGASRVASARPGVALAMDAETGARPLRWRSNTSIWRFGSGSGGSCASLEVVAGLPQHGRVAVGLEERHGTRRDVDHVAPGAFRQGAWAGWSGGSPGLRLELRHEAWMRRGGFHDPVRRVASIAVHARPMPGADLSVTLALFRTRGGEPQYVSEIESDRRVLRALSGTGRRLRLQLGVPAAAGSVRAAVILPEAAGRPRPPQWTLDWTRIVRASGTRTTGHRRSK
jgi:hypothetical protein